MSTDERKRLVIEYVERVWNRSDLEALDQLTAPSFTYQLGEQPPRDRISMREFLATTHAAFPDWRIEISEILADGESVAVRWRGIVTHQGPFHGIPPTGRQIRISGINMYRIAGSMIVGEWEQTDTLSMLRQLGALPAV